MKSLNIHCHTLDVYMFVNKKSEWIGPKNFNHNSQSLDINSEILYGFKCNYCNKIYFDYKSDFKVNNNDVSLFARRRDLWNNTILIFDFMILNTNSDNICLIGTKDEINAFLAEKLKEEINKNEKNNLIIQKKNDQKTDYNNLMKDLEKEKALKNKLRKDLDKLEKDKKSNFELNQKIVELNKNEIKLKEKIENLNIQLTSETDKNKVISENINEITQNLENEKKINKNLEIKIFDLEKNEKENTKKNEELIQHLNRKEKEIKNLNNDNINLNKNIENLKNINLQKDNEIKKKNDELINSNNKLQIIQKDLDILKNDKINLSKDIKEKATQITELNKNEKIITQKLVDMNNALISENKKNKEINDKLNIISTEKNKVLQQLENEQKIKKILEAKISNIENNEKEKTKKNEELIQFLNQKEKEIQNLTNNNNNLNKNIEILKINNLQKENEIKNISKDLEIQKSDNKKILEKNAELENKIKTLDKDLEKQKNENKETLEKNVELENKIKDLAKEMFGLNFKSDCKEGQYDIVLAINSFKSLLKKYGGWPIKYCLDNGKKNYLNKKTEKTIVLGVIGNANKGKSFILEQLLGYNIPKGFNVKTEGLSIRYGSSADHNVTMLDSAGQETPLLEEDEESNIKDDINNINNNENECSTQNSLDTDEDENKEECQKKEEKNKRKKVKEEKNKNGNNKDHPSESGEFEEYARDKFRIEKFLQKFIINYSNILILVIGNISLTEQKLLWLVEDQVFKGDINNKKKKLFVIHNLKEFSTQDQVNDYIENKLKKLKNTKLEEVPNQFLSEKKIDNFEKDKFYDKHFVEKDKYGNVNVIHLIFVNAYAKEISEYYNFPTIVFIQKSLELVDEREPFPVIDECKDFFIKNSEDIMEEDLKKEDLITIEGEKEDRIILQNATKITLKKLILDEIGSSANKNSDTIDYSCYIKPDEKMLYVNLKLPGLPDEVKIRPKIEIKNGLYYFIYTGTYCEDETLKKDKEKGENKLVKIDPKNEIKTINYRVEIKIPNSDIHLRLDEGDTLKSYYRKIRPQESKGVYTYKYNILMINNKNETNEESESEEQES